MLLYEYLNFFYERNTIPGTNRLKSFFDSLPLRELDEASISKRFPVLEVGGKRLDLGAHIYRTLIFTDLADTVMDQGMDEREVILVIDASLDAIYSTLRFFLESQGSTFDGENGLILSNAFMRLKTDLHDAMRFYPAGTATVQALGRFHLRAAGVSGK